MTTAAETTGIPASSPRNSSLCARLHDLVSATSITRPHPGILAIRRGDLVVLVASSELWVSSPQWFAFWQEPERASHTRLLLLGDLGQQAWATARNARVTALLGADPTDAELFMAIEQAFDSLDAQAKNDRHGQSLVRYRYELGELIEISRALTTEREINRLLGLILEKSRFITGADAGSLYVVEGTDAEISRRTLHFKLSQNDSLQLDWSEFTMPISPQSMAGWVALEQKTLRIADTYDLPPNSPFGFDRSFDTRIGYRTKSMLCAPLISARGEVIGVLQLINKKRDPRQRLLRPEDFERFVIPFDDRSEQLLTTLAAQAGIALENALLYEEIRGLFEGFVKASVDAIESRDPTTSGHSRRVAELTVGLAHAVERCDLGPFRDVRWRREDLREIEYASLLHDFGKIGVREHVLVKAKKLFPHELERIRARFDFLKRTLEAEIAARKLQVMTRGGATPELSALDEELARRLVELDEAWQTVTQANEPTVLKAGDFQRIEELGRQTYTRLDGQLDALLSSSEVASLSVMRGSLTPEEFDEIRNHVTHTYRFLSRIPWGRAFARVPLIAGAHHERLNGTGYPHRLRGEEIPLQSKMMSVADIFDALTASDRPYKRAVPLEKALDILGLEVKDGHLDGELVRLFIESESWKGVTS